jgi:hypothetical protein
LNIHRITLVLTCLCVLLAGAAPALCWSNGGFSANPANPDYGTHDWIAQHALDYLPAQEKQYITDNLMLYLLGTELPDNSNKSIGGIGDTTKHHVYYNSAGTLVDDAAAARANDTFNQALVDLESKNYPDAAKTAGEMAHYIADVAVFAHDMGKSTDWGDEHHHSDYEDYVDTRTNSYSDTFNKYLSYDGSLTITTAYHATVVLAYNTTFGGSNHLGCVWMDTNYDWSNQVFCNRCGESLNLAVNAVADVLHTLYVESFPSATITPSPTPTPTPTVTLTPQHSTTPTQTSASTTTPKPSSTVTPTPAAPEFPTAILLIATVLALTAVAILCRKKPQSRL